MISNCQLLLKDLERDLFFGESEGERFAAPSAGSGPLRSIRFAADGELQAVARGQIRLGRSNDPGSPAPIRSQGAGVRKVQRALIDLGFALPFNGDDGRYGQETYNAVLAYKRQHNIRTASGYLDGIVGSKTITRLDAQFPTGPLPACMIPGPPTVASAEREVGKPATSGGIPWFTCDPRLDPSPTGMCNRRLPDHGTLQSEGGGAVSTSLVGGFYCVNQPRIHLGFIATWVEMLSPEQRPPGQRQRSPSTPRFDVSFRGYGEEGLEPGRRYARDLTVSAPGIGSLDFLTSLQKNRLIRVEYTISESAT